MGVINRVVLIHPNTGEYVRLTESDLTIQAKFDELRRNGYETISFDRIHIKDEKVVNSNHLKPYEKTI